MIYMNCPSCDAQGRIPEEKVNTAIVCKKCLKTFHVKPSGHAVAGGPPIPGAAASHGHPHAVDHSADVDQLLDKINTSWHKAAPILAVVIAVLGGFGAYIWSQPTLEQRATVMATALARGDQDTIRKLSLPGTDAAAVEWLNALHTEVRDSIQATDSTVPVTTVIATQLDPGIGEVMVRARVSPEQAVGRKAIVEGAAPSAAAMATSIDVQLVLNGGIWSGWRLDGKRTLESFQKEAAKRTASVHRR